MRLFGQRFAEFRKGFFALDNGGVCLRHNQCAVFASEVSVHKVHGSSSNVVLPNVSTKGSGGVAHGVVNAGF